MAMKETSVQTDAIAETELADAIEEAWNTPPWSCNLDRTQQRVMARIAAKVARG